jgi:2-C-methyl-D-erythritol 4-phosphate cytidylyltransferase
MGPDVDKLFLEVCGRPLVAHTWSRFDSHPLIEQITVVVRSGMESVFQELAAEIKTTKPFSFAVGGKERQDSVWNGLEALPVGTELVAIQDGARPCTSARTISDVLAAAREVGAAVAGQRVTDTIKEAAGDGMILRNVERAKLWAVQTPQCFRVDVIRRALAEMRARGMTVTDDTAACELIGQAVKLVESSAPNPKATTAADIPYIEMLLRRS